MRQTACILAAFQTRRFRLLNNTRPSRDLLGISRRDGEEGSGGKGPRRRRFAPANLTRSASRDHTLWLLRQAEQPKGPLEGWGWAGLSRWTSRLRQSLALVGALCELLPNSSLCAMNSSRPVTDR